jgi:hypothetical protein
MRAIAVFGVLGLALSSHAILVIDSFDDGEITLKVNTALDRLSDIREATVFGDERATFIHQTTTNSVRHSSLDVWDGSFSMSNAFNTVSVGSLGYGYFGVAADGTFFYDSGNNFTQLAGLQELVFDFDGNDQPLMLQVRFFSNGSVNRYAKNVAGGQMTPFTVSITNADLMNGMPMWGNFDALRIDFFTSNAGDFQLSQITAVPEPTTMAALAVGAIALLRRRRK